MISVRQLLIALVVSLAFLPACKKPTSKQASYIPKDAVIVVSINTKSIKEKLMKSPSALDELSRLMSNGDTAAANVKQEWKAFQEAGIDLDQDMFMAVIKKQDEAGGNASTITAGIAILEDAGKLQAYIKQKDPTAEIKKEEGFSYVSTAKGGSLVGWNREVVIMMGREKTGGNEVSFDSSSQQFQYRSPVNADADNKAALQSYFNLKENESVASIDAFRQMVKEHADMGCWINATSASASMPLQLPRVKELLADTYTAATINFEQGKIVGNSITYFSDALTNILKEYPSQPIDLGLLKKYPAENANGFIAVSFNPQVINGIINFLEVRAIADNLVRRQLGDNASIDKILQSVKGEMVIVGSGFSLHQQDSATATFQQTKPGVDMLLNIPVGDMASMEILLAKLVEMQVLVKTGSTYKEGPVLASKGQKVMVDNKNLLAATNQSTLSNYIAGSGQPAFDDKLLEPWKGKSAAMYINFESMFQGLATTENDTSHQVAMVNALRTFKDMRASVDKFDNKAPGHFELRFREENENSLIALARFFSTIKANNKNKGIWQMNHSDTLIMP